MVGLKAVFERGRYTVVHGVMGQADKVVMQL
jgi:hypothetical protein